MGDSRRCHRLVLIASRAASRPAGKVTDVFSDGASREAAFRFVENDGVDPTVIAQAAHRATARRCADKPFVFVPTDGSSLHLVDRKRIKGLGIVGPWQIGASGLHVMTSIAVVPNGTPAGLCAQRFWTRAPKPKVRKKDRRLVEDKETRFWIDAMRQTGEAFGREAPTVRQWFQMDRAADAWPVFREAIDTNALVTVARRTTAAC